MNGLTAQQVAICLDICLPITAGQTVAIITDDAHYATAHALCTGAEQHEAQPVIIRVPDRAVGLKHAPPAADAAIATADVVIFALAPEDGCQMWHTPGRAAASESGARVGLLFPPSSWDITETRLRGIARLTETLAQVLTDARKATLTSPAGTDLAFELAGRQGFSCHSILRHPGATATIPEWGDAEISPVEGSTSGTLVIDASMTYIGKINEPIRLRVEGGRVQAITGGDEAQRLERILQTAGPSGHNIAELGIGTVPGCAITGHKDDKVLGTVHVALGHNITLGGTVDSSIHLDGVMHRPTLTIDDSVILLNGAMAPHFLTLLEAEQR